MPLLSCFFYIKNKWNTLICFFSWKKSFFEKVRQTLFCEKSVLPVQSLTKLDFLEICTCKWSSIEFQSPETGNYQSVRKSENYSWKLKVYVKNLTIERKVGVKNDFCLCQTRKRVKLAFTTILNLPPKKKKILLIQTQRTFFCSEKISFRTDCDTNLSTEAPNRNLWKLICLIKFCSRFTCILIWKLLEWFHFNNWLSFFLWRDHRCDHCPHVYNHWMNRTQWFR